MGDIVKDFRKVFELEARASGLRLMVAPSMCESGWMTMRREGH
jgi:hypothetical protein